MRLMILILLIFGCSGHKRPVKPKKKTYQDVVNSCLDDGHIGKELKECIDIRYKKVK